VCVESIVRASSSSSSQIREEEKEVREITKNIKFRTTNDDGEERRPGKPTPPYVLNCALIVLL